MSHSSLFIGQVLENLDVTDLTTDGGAIARHEGQVIFLDEGLPQERLHAKIVDIKKRLVFAQRLQTVTPSPHAVCPKCSHAHDCGGCSWQNLTLAAQHSWKENHVRQTLARIGKIELPEIKPLVPSPQSYGYRNKMVFAFQTDETGKTVVGLRHRKSHDIIPVTACCLQPPVVMDILQSVREFLAEHLIPAYDGEKGYLRFLAVHTPVHLVDDTPQIYIEIITAPATGQSDKQKMVQALMDMLYSKYAPALRGVALTERRQRSPVAQGEREISRLGPAFFTEQFDNMVLHVPYAAFLQRNTEAATLLYQKVAEFAGLTGKEFIWDVYCGIGSIGLYLAPKAARVHGFDLQKEAIKAAKKNSRHLNLPHCRFFAGNLLTSLQQETINPDLVILDPPRLGVEQGVLDKITHCGAKKIIYVSCDVSTQARDIARLQPYWRVKTAIPFDLFVHTPHVESVVVLEPAK